MYIFNILQIRMNRVVCKNSGKNWKSFFFPPLCRKKIKHEYFFFVYVKESHTYPKKCNITCPNALKY